MAISFSDNSRQRVNGVYFNQTRPELLGTQTNTISKLLDQSQGKHYVGFQKDDDGVRIKAFYDVDAILSNKTGFPSVTKISYVQIGQITINGIPIPIKSDPDQIFFQARNPVKLTDSVGFDPNKDYWWIDAFVTNPRDILFPWKAKVDSPNVTERNLFFYPQPFGTFANRGTGARQRGESLAPSLVEDTTLANVPVTEKPNLIQEMVAIVKDQMSFEDDDILVALQAPSLSLIFQFFEGIKNAIKQADLPLVDVPSFQFFGDFLLVRSNFFEEDIDDEREYVYPVFVKVNDLNISVTIYQFDFSDGVPDFVIKGVIQGYLDLEIKKPIYTTTINSQFNNVIQFFNVLKSFFDQSNQPLSTYYSVQPAGDVLILRNTFINDEEQFYIGRQSDSNPDQLNFFYFDTDLYFDLAEEIVNADDADPFNISYEEGLITVNQELFTDYYTPSQLIGFMQKNHIQLELDLSKDWKMQYRFITALCIFDEANNQMMIYDAFSWTYGRMVAGGAEEWGEVQFDPNTNVTTSGNFPLFLKQFLDAVYPKLTDTPPAVVINPFLKA